VVLVLAPPDLDLSLPPALCYRTGPGRWGGDLGSRGEEEVGRRGRKRWEVIVI